MPAPDAGPVLDERPPRDAGAPLSGDRGGCCEAGGSPAGALPGLVALAVLRRRRRGAMRWFASHRAQHGATP